MNLDYNVLWIDDRPRQVESAIEHIKVKLARKGFNLVVKKIQEVGNESSLKRHFRHKDYDLLVVDYKMQPGARDGAQLIRSIRRFCDCTDIVFYSSERPEILRSKINVDGVYCVNRQDLRDKLEHVIHSTIKKVLDLNSMRGISLSQIADFDHLIDEIICLGHNKLVEEGVPTETIDNICEQALRYHQQQCKDLEVLPRDRPISEYTYLLSSNPKHGVLLDLLRLFDDETLDICSSRISSYEGDVIGPRNKLAHAMMRSYEDGRYVLTNNSKEIIFKEDDFTNLRLKLLEYRDHLQQIRDTIIKRSESN